MKKEDAKTVLANVHDEILRQIEKRDDTVDESMLIDFLHDVANALIKTDFRAPFNFYAPYMTFEEEYKQLAVKSLDSYNDSNKMFAEITQQQQNALDDLLDTEELTQRFSDIQTNLSSEVERANQTITQLSSRVKELESKASIDPLTKVFNRRAMDQYLGGILDITEHEVPMHLLLVDVDDFKHVNDTYGHIAGDKVLIVLANIMKSTLRDGDRIFRYGGEEFIIALNRITDEGCKIVAERILTLARNNKLLYKNEQFSVTLSIGATVMQQGDTIESLINRADQALYRAKERGKDQMEVEL
ncbi:MAG: GGDEF domain-containing protein [Sulfurimonadaceae bacterium]|nr:GGDEF domain-containing protein [Sulfurimonadaceae bacterium]